MRIARTFPWRAVPKLLATACAGAFAILGGYSPRDAVAQATTRCSPRDFKVSVLKFRKEYDKHKFTGTVTNNGTQPCGVQLKVSTYDQNGEVIETADFWPASIRNIEPGARENFWYFVNYDKAAKTYDAVAIDAKSWLRR